ncbi:MAG: hypothetical protein VST68_01750 [Nitrospirota bacterium]|nr:hypothetical protein [Nitrospirota bacterium]
MNISLACPIQALDEIDISKRREWSKKFVISPAQSQGRQDALLHGQGRSHFDARSVLTGPEHGNMARTTLAGFFTIPSISRPDWAEEPCT